MFVKAHRALRRAVVLPMALSLVAVNYGLAASVTGGQQEKDFASLAAVDRPLIDETGEQRPPAAANNSVETETSAGNSVETKTETSAGAGHEEPLAEQTEDSNSSSKKAWIYGGLGAAAAVAIVAVAASSGGGSDSDATAATTLDNNASGGTGTGTNSSSSSSGSGGSKKCNTPPRVNQNPRSPVANNPNATHVCADLSGRWSGLLDLTGDDGSSVTATINQDGGKLQITTSSQKDYAQVFIGEVAADCSILVQEQKRGKTWSTHFGPVNASRIALYDYADLSCLGDTKFDRLILTR